MTIICALTDGVSTWIGSDSRSTGGDGYIYDMTTEKWIQLGNRWIGCSGTGRLLWLMKLHQADLSAIGAHHDVPEAIRDLLVKDGWTGEEKPGEAKRFNANFVMAAPGLVLGITGSFSTFRPDSGFCAMGDGELHAEAAAFTARKIDPDMAGAMIVDHALDAAIKFCSGCGGEKFLARIDPIPDAEAPVEQFVVEPASVPLWKQKRGLA